MSATDKLLKIVSKRCTCNVILFVGEEAEILLSSTDEREIVQPYYSAPGYEWQVGERFTSGYVLIMNNGVELLLS